MKQFSEVILGLACFDLNRQSFNIILIIIRKLTGVKTRYTVQKVYCTESLHSLSTFTTKTGLNAPSVHKHFLPPSSAYKLREIVQNLSFKLKYPSDTNI